MAKMADAKKCLPLNASTSKYCNSGTNYDTELKSWDFSYLIDMFMCTKNEKL